MNADIGHGLDGVTITRTFDAAETLTRLNETIRGIVGPVKYITWLIQIQGDRLYIRIATTSGEIAREMTLTIGEPEDKLPDFVTSFMHEVNNNER